MTLIIGIVLALFVAALAAVTKFDRRTFYAVVLVVVGHYYVLFAVMAGSVRATIIESLVMAAFVLLAGVGFRMNPWIIVAGLAVHGVQDIVHGQLVNNPGVPVWWPFFCMAFDVAAAGLFAVSLARTPSGTGAVLLNNCTSSRLPSSSSRPALVSRRF